MQLPAGPHAAPRRDPPPIDLERFERERAEREQADRERAEREHAARETAERERARRGRDATIPEQIPRRGWWDILRRTLAETSRDNLGLVAAGVAFYSLLALPPALAAAIALWGLLADPQTVQSQMLQLAAVLPPEAATIFRDQLQAVAARSQEELSWTALGALLFSLWSARLAVGALMGGLNVVYEERERRGFLRFATTAVALTLLLLVGGLLVVTLLAVVPAGLAFAGLAAFTEALVGAARWVLLLALVTAGLAVLYRLGPSRRHARWQWVSWGAGVATVLWLAASAGFSAFVANFATYGETYGAIAGVVVLLMWLWVSAYVALFGAELNAEMEHQTARDTTVGPERALGERGAWVADHVAD